MSLAVALAVICTIGVAEARPKPPPDDPPARQCQPLTDGTAEVRWGRAISSNGCFFFSGPHQLGRDDQLGDRARYQRRGDQVTARFGDAVFSGVANADRVRLERRSAHEAGGTWNVTEVIEARFVVVDGCTILRGTYRYQECPAGQRCADGCTISAPVSFRGR